jgi:hypothetical protein
MPIPCKDPLNPNYYLGIMPLKPLVWVEKSIYSSYQGHRASNILKIFINFEILNILPNVDDVREIYAFPSLSNLII